MMKFRAMFLSLWVASMLLVLPSALLAQGVEQKNKKTQRANALPDLTITGINYNYKTFKAWVRVANVGKVSSPACSLLLHTMGSDMKKNFMQQRAFTAQVPALEPGEITAVELNLDTPEGPYGPTKAMVDNRRRVNEAKEDNNLYVIPDKTKTY